ncbi:4295_t:CDS:2, partial [Gigaspora rosea]
TKRCIEKHGTSKKYKELFSKQDGDIIIGLKETKSYLLNQDKDIANFLESSYLKHYGKTKYTIPKIIQEGEREQLARKLTMAISESGTTDYRTQELQSLISSCLKNYIHGEKERLDLSVPKESGLLKKSTSEDKTLSPTKKVELQNKVTQEMKMETYKTKSSNPSVDSKSVQTPKEEDPIQVLKKKTSSLKANNIKKEA